MSDSFDRTAKLFTERVQSAADWKQSYLGAAYATRIAYAITELEEAIQMAKQNPEIADACDIAPRSKHF